MSVGPKTEIESPETRIENIILSLQKQIDEMKEQNKRIINYICNECDDYCDYCSLEKDKIDIMYEEEKIKK